MAVSEGRLYGEILDAAVERLDADAGSIQLVDVERSGLRLVVSRGIHPASAAFWEFVPADSTTSCGAALAVGERMVMADVEAMAALAGSGNLREYRRSELRAVQSTPVRGGDGAVLAVLSTHWRQPHAPHRQELRAVDELVQELALRIPRFAGAPAPLPDATETAHRQYAMGVINRRIAISVGKLDSAFVEITGERGSATFLCACGRETCRSRTLTVSLDVYDRVRESPHRFLVAPGHGVSGIDQVVEDGDGYQIVELKSEYHQPADAGPDGDQ